MSVYNLAMNKFDLIIIGGGAAGLMAATSSIRVGKKVLLLEKNAKLGVKILMSGGTRCNITHACESREIVSAFGPAGRFLHSALASLPPERVIGLIESVGVATKIERGGKIFPTSDKAIDVRDALVELATNGTEPGSTTIMSSTPCLSISKTLAGFEVVTERQTFNSKSVLVTTGGKSYPGCGTTGDGYQWARRLGHTIVNPVAALTPVTNEASWSHQLKGVSFEKVKLKITDKANNSPLDQRTGAFLFTHFGFSGPSALDISRTVSLSQEPDQLNLDCDFEPDLNEENLRHELTQIFQSNPKNNLINILARRYTRRFCEAFLQAIEIAPDQKVAELSKTKLNRITSRLKNTRFPIKGVYGFKKAEVTSGGVTLAEIDSRTMESKICPGLYFAGEVIDLDGPIGGYNFQAAFSTGWLAGIHA